MKSSKGIVSITDHITDFSVENKVLGQSLNYELNQNTKIILVWHKTIDKEFLDKFENITAIFRYGVGYDNIDLSVCEKKKIVVCNNPDYGVDEVSDSAIAMILSLTRGINSFQKFAKDNSNSWLGADIPFRLRRLKDLKLGIIGLGRIGGSIARKYKAFSENIVFFDPYQPSGIEKTFSIDRTDNLDELLKESDIITINTPLTEITRGLVDYQFISKMKKESFLINLSRGQIVQNKDLIRNSLLSGKLSGYGTDVWTDEPPDKEDNLYSDWLLNKDYINRLIITPHTAYYSEESLFECRHKTALNCLNYIQGKEIKNRIV